MIYTITLNPAIDRLIKVRGSLTKKKTNRVNNTEFDLGGKGLHVSHVLTKFRIENQALGFIGENNLEQMKKILEIKEINHQLFVEKGASTRECIVIVDDSHNGSMMVTEDGFHVSDENHQLLIDFIQQQVTSKDMAIIAGSLPPDYTLQKLKEIMRMLKKKGCFIGCDLSGEALTAAVEMEVDFIKPNQFEAEELFANQESHFVDNIRKLAKKIAYVVVSLGKDGSYVVHGEEMYRVLPPQIKERNDTGAGDVFVGAFLAQLAKGADLQTVIRYATGCSASKVTKSDCTSFDIHEAEGFFNEITIFQMGENQHVIS
ncbi:MULTISPECIES: 1-phosphofructokinase family hexose kinase [Bacillus]|uniref:Carbohydrate kinase n=2 Tax=Bacillus TaxID=1386 RepID=A0A0M3RAD9_9BACI|nr:MULTISPECIES: 1-phosphofructokinase family hexose kinase [Bacillus]ALC83006.1 carbohydrate kinase [Bacillus gobiensis]MBP1082026.1 1-phosphofructokinase [Bacillus capparidis]MED1096656.1 1-phosphofructokinase family hexose kinase [Bacillus capparidis]